VILKRFIFFVIIEILQIWLKCVRLQALIALWLLMFVS